MNGQEVLSLQRVITIRTPENLEISYALAGAGTRAAAYLLDLVLMIFALQLGSNLIVAVLSALPAGGSQYTLAIIGLISGAAYGSYFMVFELLMSGQTPGKRVVGLRVIKEGGYALGILDTLLRNLMRFVDFLPLFYGVGLVSLLVTERSQRLGDLVAGTFVVYQDQIEAESLAPQIPEFGGTAPVLPPELVAAIPQPLISACVDFFWMLPDLGGKARQELAAELLDLVRATSGLVPARTSSAEAVLAAVIRQSGQTAPV